MTDARSRPAAWTVSLRASACSSPLLLLAQTSFAIDSYRYLHVSIETPWMIFLFLCVAIFVPFILMVGLMWGRQFNKPPAKVQPKAAPPPISPTPDSKHD